MDAVPDALLASRYDLGPLVGLGGTAQVYRAWDHEDGCPVAVKIFRPGSALAPGYGGARELVALTGVRHRGLVGVRGAGVDPQGCPFVVMDLVDGQSLSARLHDGPLDIAAVTRLGAALADALAVVHARGVVHRDVKPANVLLDTDGHPWLTDFGIARVVDATRVTATGVVVGTAAYMAPEQVRGEAVGSAADIYALGLVLLEAATGHREYDGGALESAVARLHRAPVVPASLPDPLGPTLRRMTAPVPDDRPPASEVAAALRRPPAGSPPRRARTVAAIAARRAAPVAALACLVAGALTGALSLAGSEHPAEEPRVAVAPAAAPPVPLVLPPDVAVLADEPAAAPVPVALANPDRTAPRVTAARSGSGRDDSADERNGDNATADASRNAHRNGADHTSAGSTKDVPADKGDEDHDRSGKGDGTSSKGKSGKGGTSGKDAGGGHGGKDGHSGSGSGKG